MSVKFLVHSPDDLSLLKGYPIPHPKKFPCIIKMPDIICEGDDFVGAGCYEESDPEAMADGYPIQDVWDTYIIYLKDYTDSLLLKGATESWSPETFQNAKEFIERPYFIVSGNTRCRWYKRLSEAQTAFPFAMLCDIEDYLNKGLFDIPLDEII